MTGIDIIGHIMGECESNVQNGVLKAAQLIEAINSAKSCLENIKNTNAFMLMTINRCLDYTKASSGMKLVPKTSSVDLLEAITVPVKCMQNLQTKIEVNLLPLSSEICTYIITDQQWLQENLLCLLANAVKYSDKGTVNVSVTLKNKEFEEKYFMESNNRRSFLDYLSSVSSQPSGSAKYNGNGGAMVYPEGIFHQPSLLQDIEEEDQAVNPPTLQKAKSMRALGLQEKTLLASFFKLIRSSLFEYFLHFEIEDEGVGFDPSRLEEVFHPFDHQGDRIVGGTGLGLYSLAKRVEALNGLYGVKARPDGKQGSIFWFSIPYQPDQAASELDVVSFTDIPSNIHSIKRPRIVPRLLLEQIIEAAETRANMKVSNDNNNHSNLNTANKSVVASLSKPNTGHMKPKNVILNILVVDDSPTITKMTKMMLRRLGHKVSIAENGEIALKMIKDHWHIDDTTVSVNVAYDVIVMDLQMPIMDGLQATKELRKQEKAYGNYHQDFHHLIIGVSANSDPETTQDAYSAGIDYFIAKPFTVETFYHAVNKFYRYNGKL